VTAPHALHSRPGHKPGAGGGRAEHRERGGGLSSVRNAARLLRAFAPTDRDLGVSELATRLGLPKSSVHRLLTTLAAEGLVERTAPNGRYRLGLRLYELGAIVSSHLDLHEVVSPYLDDLRNRTGETVHVSILDAGEVVYVERRESSHTLRIFRRVGHRNHAHCTSSGKILLAWLSADERRRIYATHGLPPHTVHTITDPDLLEEELVRVRERGYAQNINESERGASSVAAPIRDVSGSVIAAIAIAAPSARFSRESMRRFASEVVAAAERISSHLGYLGSAGSSLADARALRPR
jgi:IclR family transcriptional regulator, KDG regulon repressor